jgi:transcriptional regulator GlxA family with amidase domain
MAEMPEIPRNPPSSSRIVEILAFPSVQLLDVAGPLQVFATANEQTCGADTAAPYAPIVTAPVAGAVPSSAGLAILAQDLARADEPADTLIVAGGPGVHAAAANAALLAWLAVHARAARRVCSVCTGAFLLAAAGLLDGRRAVTHWRWCAEFARRFPAVHVEADPIFVRDGPIWSSAGVTAGIDLALALLEEDLGRSAALAVARHLVMFLKRPGGQAQFSAALAAQHAEDRFARLHEWMRTHIDRELSVAVLAAEAGMSERSFLRHYRHATGGTPARTVERLRVEAARRLLSDTRLPLKRIAVRCGFGSQETMRRSFLRLLRTNPQVYRERFPG